MGDDRSNICALTTQFVSALFGSFLNQSSRTFLMCSAVLVF